MSCYLHVASRCSLLVSHLGSLLTCGIHTVLEGHRLLTSSAINTVAATKVRLNMSVGRSWAEHEFTYSCKCRLRRLRYSTRIPALRVQYLSREEQIMSSVWGTHEICHSWVMTGTCDMSAEDVCIISIERYTQIIVTAHVAFPSGLRYPA